MVVKFQVERRPVGPTGKVYYGRERGDGVSVLSNPFSAKLGGPSGLVKTVMQICRGSNASYVPMGGLVIPPLREDNGEYSHVVEQQGEPWLVHSSHHAIDAAIESAAPLAAAIGAGNVRIIKVMNHTTKFELN